MWELYSNALHLLLECFEESEEEGPNQNSERFPITKYDKGKMIESFHFFRFPPSACEPF